MSRDAPRLSLHLLCSSRGWIIPVVLVSLGGWREYQRRKAVRDLLDRMEARAPGSMQFTIIHQYSENDPLEALINRVQGFRLEPVAVPGVVQALHRAYSANDLIAATYAERALNRLAPEEALTEFTLQIKRGAWSMSRGKCFKALTKLAELYPELTPRIRAALGEFIDCRELSVVPQAVDALAEVEWKADPETARLSLEQLLKHKDHLVRDAATRRLIEFGGRSRTPPATSRNPNAGMGIAPPGGSAAAHASDSAPDDCTPESRIGPPDE